MPRSTAGFFVVDLSRPQPSRPPMDLIASELAPSVVGTLIDEVPLIVSANVRPYVVAIVLHRGAVAKHELVAALTPHCSVCDLKEGGWSTLEGDYTESTRLESIVDEVLGEFVAANLLRYNEESRIWVAHNDSIRYWITKATELDASVPPHLLQAYTKNVRPQTHR
jgi:hypothetical protein